MRYRQRHTRERPLGFHSETSSVPYRAGLPDRTRHEHGRVQRHRGSAGQERDGLAHPAGRGLQPVRGDREGVLGSPLYCLPALSATPPTDRSRYEGATQEEKRDHGPHHEGQRNCPPFGSSIIMRRVPSSIVPAEKPAAAAATSTRDTPTNTVVLTGGRIPRPARLAPLVSASVSCMIAHARKHRSEFRSSRCLCRPSRCRSRAAARP